MREAILYASDFFLLDFSLFLKAAERSLTCQHRPYWRIYKQTAPTKLGPKSNYSLPVYSIKTEEQILTNLFLLSDCRPKTRDKWQIKGGSSP